jgi:hypothetical protein
MRPPAARSLWATSLRAGSGGLRTGPAAVAQPPAAELRTRWRSRGGGVEVRELEPLVDGGEGGSPPG